MIEVQAVFGVASLIVDVATVGSGSIIKGEFKTLIREGEESFIKTELKQGFANEVKEGTEFAIRKAKKILKERPTIDKSGKVHGELPSLLC